MRNRNRNKNKSKTIIARFFSLLIAAVLLLASFTPVSAESDSYESVHADPATFLKNYELTPEQKQYAVTEIERVVSRIIDPDMSDLEKYYTLAVWEHRHVKYDSQFWSGSYDMDLYRHQWDAYGALKEKSVCVGMSILYADLCHAADLPCKVVRFKPEYEDHTINYIPDISGHPYYVDITQDAFLESVHGYYIDDPDYIDKDFAYITEDCTDQSFEYKDEDGLTCATSLRECYNKPYEEWYTEYAEHSGTDKEFLGTYEEKGSGVPASDSRYTHLSYYDSPSQYSATEPPQYAWFLEDFYEDPGAIQQKVLNMELDEELLDISGVEDFYDCSYKSDLRMAVMLDIMVKCFPSCENGEVVPWEADLKTNSDYTIKCTSLDKSKGEAVVTLTGANGYSGTYDITVRIPTDINDAEVELSSAGFTYNGKVQKPTVKTVGGMELTEGTDYTLTWSDASSKNVGEYTVTVTGAGEYSGTTEATYTIGKAANPMKLKGKTAKVRYRKLRKKARTIKRSKALTVSKAQGKLSYKLVSAKKGKKSFKKYFKVNAKTGKITVKKRLRRGTYKVKVKVKAAGNANYKASAWKTVTFKVRVR